MINWRLKKLIVERCGSQVDFSMKIGRSQSYVSEIIRGRRPFSDKEKASWAQALDVNPAIIEQTDKTALEEDNQ
jgi:transcriptional regulator with XRE-family HTH domain